MQHRLLQRKERKGFPNKSLPRPRLHTPNNLLIPVFTVSRKHKPIKFFPFPHHREISPFRAPSPTAPRALYSPQKFQIFQTFLSFLIKHESFVIKMHENFTHIWKNTCFPATWTLRFSNPSPYPRFGLQRLGGGSQKQIKFRKGNPGRKRSIWGKMGERRKETSPLPNKRGWGGL